MADFKGVRDLAAVLTGADAIEAAAYDAGRSRLITQRAAQARMDRAIHQAAQEKIAADALTSLANRLPAGRDRDLILGKRGSDFSSVQTGIGTEQENAARAAALEAILTGEDPDLINRFMAVSSGKLLAPTNVAVERQAVADATQSEAVAAFNNARTAGEIPARISALEALTSQREAAAGYDKARTANPAMFRAGSGSGQGLPPATTLETLFAFDPETQTMPELQTFLDWQAMQAEKDPQYLDFWHAYRAYRTGKEAVSPGEQNLADAISGVHALPQAAVLQGDFEEAITSDPGNPPAPGEQPSPDRLPADAPGYGNSADAQLLIEAAERAIANGADPQIVEARLRSELTKRGFTYGTQ